MLAVVESEGVLRQFFEKPNKRRIIRILVINNAQEWITSFNSYFQLNNLNIEDLKDSDSDWSYIVNLGILNFENMMYIVSNFLLNFAI